MDKCKWNVKILNHYFRLTVENRFIILGYRGENWKELVNINFTLCQYIVLICANGLAMLSCLKTRAKLLNYYRQ